MIVIAYRNEKLTKYTKNESPILLKGRTIKRPLLDGVMHIQTVGKAYEYITMEIYAYKDKAIRINEIEATGGVFDIVCKDRVIKAYLESPPSWSMALRGDNLIYQANVTFLVRGYYDKKE